MTHTSTPPAAPAWRTPNKVAEPPAKANRSAALRLLGKSSWGLADQMLISLTNFITMVLLARGLGPSGFGTFVLIFTVLQFANSLQGALIIQPHNVLGATRHGADYVRYTASTALAQILFLGGVALLILGSAVLAHGAGFSVAPLLYALVVAVIAWQMQEFVRRVLYTEVRLSAAFANDVLSYGGQTVAIAALWRAEALTGPTALYALAATSALAAAVGVWQLRGSLAGPVDMAALGENWRFGKWLGGAEIGYWLSSQLYLLLTGLMLGTAAAGMLKAAYVIFGPTRVLGFFLRSVLPTWFARTQVEGGTRALHGRLKMVYAVAAPLLGSYCLLVAICAGPLLRLLYGDQFAGHAGVVVFYAAFAFIAFMASIVNAALRAKRLTRSIFTTQMSAILTLPAGWLCIRTLGIEGAVLGMILTSLTVNFFFWRAYLGDRKGCHQPQVAES